MRLLSFAKCREYEIERTVPLRPSASPQQSAQRAARPRLATIQTPAPFLELGHVTYSLESLGLEGSVHTF
jgi:hypothetical protein